MFINKVPSAQATHEYFYITNGIQARNADPTCGYPSKRCNNPRAVKRTGDLHRFCEFHRHQANENQRNRERRRLEQQSREILSMEVYMQQLNEQYDLLIQEEEHQHTLDPQPSELLSRLDLDEEDLRVLAAVLSVDEDSG
ncbi:hypothetical protein Gpo141_00003506 [Globisporangium polare]